MESINPVTQPSGDLKPLENVCRLSRLPPRLSVQNLRDLLTDFHAERIFLKPIDRR
jgi:hypothetical protein